MSTYPFSAVVGSDDMALALILTTIAPEIGGVLVRGEKGTAKSTMVRGLADVLPDQRVVPGCRFGCDPERPSLDCPDGPHEAVHTDIPAPSGDGATMALSRDDVLVRPARLIELPIGATEDRVVGSMDLGQALGHGRVAFEPGLLAAAHRGVLYVDEVNLLQDHLVDVLLDAAAMGRNTVERDGVSISHAARMVLVGTMNPEEGELRPQLLDRFGLTVEVKASREPNERAEVVRRRLAFEMDPDSFAASWADRQADLTTRLDQAHERLQDVALTDQALTIIARVCAGFEVDGLRADIVTARAAKAHAAWRGAKWVQREDIRAAALLSLPHRRRRNPFDAPGIDEDLLDSLLGDDDPPPPEDPDDAGPDGDDQSGDGADDEGQSDGGTEEDGQNEDSTHDDTADDGQGERGPGASDNAEEPSPRGTDSHEQPRNDTRDDAHSEDVDDPGNKAEDDAGGPQAGAAPVGTAVPSAAYATRRLEVRGTGGGPAGRRSRALDTGGRTVSSRRGERGRLHLPATLAVAARRGAQVRPGAGLRLIRSDLRVARTQGREANLVLFTVDASGSMAARQRMEQVKTALLSLLMDAYQRRDRVGLVTFRGSAGELALPPTGSVEAAARCLQDLPHGGRTPLAEGLMTTARTLATERLRDPRRRALVVLITDGRATSGPEALARARRVADQWGADPHTPETVVVDSETGRFRMGLAAELAGRMAARHLSLGEIAAGDLVNVVNEATASRPETTVSSAGRAEVA